MASSHEFDSSFHLISAIDTVCVDTSKFTELPCGLYMNKDGVIAYRTISNYNLIKENGKPFFVYLSTIYNADPGNENNAGLKEMKYVVDTASFETVGTFYFKDKHHVYDFHPMTGGGTIAVNRVMDVNSFKVLENDAYAKDKKHCYYRGEIIQDADWQSFRVLDSGYYSLFAFDKNNFYNGEKIMTDKEIKEENLDSVKQKRYRYLK